MKQFIGIRNGFLESPAAIPASKPVRQRNDRWRGRLCHLVCAGGMAWLGVVASYAAEPPLNDPNQPYDQFSMEVVTPHVAWANPSVTGPLEALVIAPCWQFRDTVELAQRLSRESRKIATVRNDRQRIVQRQLEIYRQILGEGERR